MSYISALPTTESQVKFPRSLVILGSTGSIGVNGLKVAAEHSRDFQVLGLAGARNTKLLAEQAKSFRPPYLAVLDEGGARDLAARLPKGYSPEILIGPEGYVDMASLDRADLVLAAQVGAAGLPPTLAAVKAGKMVALANKESLVLAGDLIRETCAESGAVILPVDSEHNALFQAMAGHHMDDVRKIILTASGGPFRGKDIDFLKTVTPKSALKHPNWSMGAKISIDSATLMNKGLEVIEASRLYGVGPDRIQVVVHPQSIIHSLVEYHDGSLLAHLGIPDMRIPIAYCMAFPKRPRLDLPRLDLAEIGSLTFERPDLNAFPCLKMAVDCLELAESSPGRAVVLNAANEEAVALFLDERISFLDIPALVGRALEKHDQSNPGPADSLERILKLDQETRDWIKTMRPPES